MSETLTYKDTLQRVGHTVINETQVCQYVCIIPSDDPSSMRVTMTRLNEEMYKEHRDICRADFAKFEDAAYILQEEYLAKMNA